MEILKNHTAQHTQNERKHGEQNQVAFVAAIFHRLIACELFNSLLVFFL